MSIITKFGSVTVHCSETPNVNWEYPSDGTFRQQEGLHIWYVDKSRFSKEEIFKFKKILSKEELAKADRFHFEKDRVRYTLTHGVLRVLLSKYLEIKHSDISFEQNELGKPFLLKNKTLQFNLSHSDGSVLIGFRKCRIEKTFIEQQIGVDLENPFRSIDIGLIIKDYFTVDEQELILKSENPAKLFFQLWTRKEALVKATGTGLTAQLKTYNLSSSSVRELLVENKYSSQFPSQKFFIHSFQIMETYQASIAMMNHDEPINFYKL